MGTNYYARYSPCEQCGRCSVEKHIGKSSHGWKFLFQAHDSITSWEHWKNELMNPSVQIWNEYNEKVSRSEFFELVEDKQKDSANLHHHDPNYWYSDSETYDFSHREFS